MRAHRHLALWGLTCLLALPAAAGAGDKRAFAPVDRAMRAGLARGCFESAVLQVTHRGRPLFSRTYGNARLDTVFDLASLTKPLATTTTMMRLLARDRLGLDTRLDALLPATRDAPLGTQPLCRLLTHSAGLPAANQLARRVEGLPPARAKRRMQRRLGRRTPVYRPGTRALYSDLNFLLLGWALERAGGAPLDRLADGLVFAPLGLSHTGFLPTEGELPGRWRIAPTEVQNDGTHLRGVVHDLKARRLGGVAGHAGLFSTAPEIQRIADALIDAYQGRASVFSPAVVRRFFDARPLTDTPFAMGWARPGFFEGSETAGVVDAETTVGHHGFTGTSLWIDPARELSVVLLTNRVFFGRDPQPIAELRRTVHGLLGESLRGSVAPPTSQH